MIGETEADVKDKLAWIRSHYEKLVPAERVRARPSQLYAGGPLVGTAEQFVERLRELDGLGLTYAICYFLDAAYDRSAIELFESQVIPALS